MFHTQHVPHHTQHVLYMYRMLFTTLPGCMSVCVYLHVCNIKNQTVNSLFRFPWDQSQCYYLQLTLSAHQYFTITNASNLLSHRTLGQKPGAETQDRTWGQRRAVSLWWQRGAGRLVSRTVAHGVWCGAAQTLGLREISHVVWNHFPQR